MWLPVVDVVELRRDAHAVAVLAHAAFDHIADAELVGDLLHVDGLALVDKRRVARDHEEPAQLGQRRDDVLADAVGEILLLRIAAHVGEGKHGDGGPVGQRQRRARLLVDVVRRRAGRRRRLGAVLLRAHRADEAKALARDGADQPLVFAAVADRLARGIDAAAQGRIRNDPAAPDRRDEIIFADDAVAVLDQIDQQVEHLRLDGNRLRPAAQLAPVGIKRMIGKEKLHGYRPKRRRPLSRNNQARLKDKSSAGQSLPAAFGHCSSRCVSSRSRSLPQTGDDYDRAQAISPDVTGKPNIQIHRISLWICRLSTSFSCTFLYAIGFVCGLVVPKDHRYRRGRPDGGSADRQPAADVGVRHPAQRDGAQAVQAMVDAVRAEADRAQHLRAVREPRADPAVLAVASDADAGVADRRPRRRHGGHGAVARRLADRADQHVPDQSFRAVRAATGRQQSRRPLDAGAALPDAALSTSSCGIRSISASSSRSGRRRR